MVVCINVGFSSFHVKNSSLWNVNKNVLYYVNVSITVFVIEGLIDA